MKTVRIQVIKTYEIEVPDDDPITHAYNMQTTKIEEEGVLQNAETGYACVTDDSLDEDES